MADPITLGALALTAAGTAVSAVGTIAGGNALAAAGQAGAAAAKQAAQANAGALEYRAQQEEMAANEARSAGQRGAIERRQAGKLLLSSLQARSAASGGSADDPSTLNLASKIAQRTEYQALTEMFTGESRARGLEDQAKGSRYSAETGLIEGNMRANAALREGEARKSASYLSAAGTIIGGAGSMFGTFNKLPGSKVGSSGPGLSLTNPTGWY